jgi:hypothetical protein
LKLHELAIGCWAYKAISGDDSRVTRLRQATGGRVDPHDPGHREILFAWLTQWGCRQFSKAHQVTIAGESLEAWARAWLPALPPDNVALEKIDDEAVSQLGAAYKDLRRRQAGTRTLQGGTISHVRYGPVGAAKTLFALRPGICPPWDRFTLDALGLDYSSASYCRYLRLVLADLQHIATQAGVQIAELPALVGRPNSTPPKLMDEYYWITITRGFEPPSQETINEWLTWARNG